MRVLHLVGDVPDVTRVAERDEEAPGGALGWKLKMTHLIAPGSFHGLIRLEDGRLCPITRDGGEDVFKSSWVTSPDEEQAATTRWWRGGDCFVRRSRRRAEPTSNGAAGAHPPRA